MSRQSKNHLQKTLQIKLRTAILSALALVLLGTTAGVLADKVKVSPDDYRDKDPETAAATLLTAARGTLEKDETWERIAIGQILYLSGQEAEAEALWDSIRKPEPGDWMRIGRVLYRAGEWEKAREYFDRVVDAKPKDEDWLAEVGMYYNLQGDRATAESLFDRSFEEDPDNLYNMLKAAGSYLGVEER